ncbi:uncharacterized protein LOC132560058 [Ylistrum balloti]|uniref:uncharacterized protein LOC132560058 n=1 Tax=Ylistrum balloti TaxID=509963 RepID=UPI002905BCF0|nr:uncharacterized protein LOC132560058 [Ylistrum balloti]
MRKDTANFLEHCTEPTKSKHLPFFMIKKEISIADERAKSLRISVGFGLKPSPIFTKSGCLKSHDWVQLGSEGKLKFCIRGLLGGEQRHTLFMLFDCFSDLCSESQNVDELDDTETRLNTSLACLERDFPSSLQNITTHLLHHITEGIRKFGPVYGTWMYVFERFNSWLCKRALHMQHQEATVVETYIIYDFFRQTSFRWKPAYSWNS